MFSCLGLLRFIELCIVSVSFGFACQYVCQTLEDCTLVISFVSKGFPYKNQIEELFVVMVSLCVLLTCNIVNFLINFNFLTATYLSKARYSLFVLKVPFKPQSINRLYYLKCICSLLTQSPTPRQWRIQKFWKRGAGGRQFISSVFTYRKCAQQNICLLHGKSGFLKKNWANRGGGGRPHRPSPFESATAPRAIGCERVY